MLEFSAQHAYITYLKGTIVCVCGKVIRPNQEMIQRVRTAFDIIKTPHFRASHLTSRGRKHGPQLWQKHHHKAKDAPQGTRKDIGTYTSIWDRWQNDTTYRKSQQDVGWSDAWVRYLNHIAQIDTIPAKIITCSPFSLKNYFSNYSYSRGRGKTVNNDNIR